MVDIIAPADAFRLMLAARYGKTTLRFAETVQSSRWFWYPSSAHIRVRTGKERKLAKIPLSVHTAADNTIKMLCKHVREGDIRLRGQLLPANPPIDIDLADCKDGRLDVFDQTLTIYVEGGGFKVARRYQRVFCVKKDVSKVAEKISRNRFLSSEHKPAPGKATSPQLRNAIAAVYDDAARAGTKPPNINQLPAAVQPRLKEDGLEASGRRIKEIGGEQQFRLRRLPPGQRG